MSCCCSVQQQFLQIDTALLATRLGRWILEGSEFVCPTAALSDVPACQPRTTSTMALASGVGEQSLNSALIGAPST